MNWKYFGVLFITIVIGIAPIVIVCFTKQQSHTDIALDTISIILGFAILFVGNTYTDLDKANKQLEKLNEEVTIKLDRLETHLSTLLEKTHGEIVSAEDNISNKIANQINAEYSLLNIVLKDTEAGKYFENLISLHKMLASISRTTAGSPILSRSLDLIINSTQYIEDFFKRNELGGIYKVSNVVELYESIAPFCKLLMVIEPSCMDYSANYDQTYINFLKSQSVKEIPEKEFLFLTDEMPCSTVEWLQKLHFEVNFWNKEHINLDNQRSIDYLNYSHVLFKLNDHFVSCSVLPTAARKSRANGLTNFNLTEEVYLAFRVFPVKGEERNYDRLVQLIKTLRSGVTPA